jgi:AraC-like DNA-binding protein
VGFVASPNFQAMSLAALPVFECANTSPAKAVEVLRLEAAKIMLEDGHYSLDVVARETGFADRERMRRAFVRAFGASPREIRRDARCDDRVASAVGEGSICIQLVHKVLAEG